MKLNLGVMALLPAVLAASLKCAVPALAQPAATAPDNTTFDVEQLFATTCGFCHSDGGRASGRGPQFMDSPRGRRLYSQPHQDRQGRRDAGVRLSL
jgi:hypothetical protein